MKMKRTLLIVSFVMVVPLLSVFFREGLILDMAGIHLDSPFSEKVTVDENYIRVDKIRTRCLIH
jgi:uncharacterized protein